MNNVHPVMQAAMRSFAPLLNDEPPRTHFFVHDGWGRYLCRDCGVNEKYVSHGALCRAPAPKVAA